MLPQETVSVLNSSDKARVTEEEMQKLKLGSNVVGQVGKAPRYTQTVFTVSLVNGNGTISKQACACLYMHGLVRITRYAAGGIYENPGILHLPVFQAIAIETQANGISKFN
jgi:hypothetical protein